LPNAVAHNTKLSAKLLVLFGYRLTVAGDYGDVKESGWPGSAGEPKFRVMAPAPEPPSPRKVPASATPRSASANAELRRCLRPMVPGP